MSRTSKLVLFVFFLVAAIDCGCIALAEEKAADGVIARPVVEYKSADLRDPFKEIKDAQLEKKPDSAVPGPDFNKIKVEGIIWGGRFPQAIINSKVLTVGDSIEGAEILSIDKNGITLSFAGKVANLTVSGNHPVLKK